MSGRPPSDSHKLKMSYILNDGDGRSPRHDPMDVDTPSSSSSARRRTTSHTDEKERKYPCPQCPFRFLSKGDLQKHKKAVHLGIRNHECPSCGARFAEKGNLTKHEKRHAQIREFECSVSDCPKTFVLRDGLVRHEKKVHGISHGASSSRSGAASSSNHRSSSSKPSHQSSRSRK